LATEQQSSRRVNGLNGIRAFAVVAVIAAHAHVSWFGGGGIGVDIFFTLSGFLITTLLLRERESTGRISLVKFWGRRLLRLMPALLLMLFLVDAAGLVIGSELWFNGLVATPSVVFYFANWVAVFGGGSGALGVFAPLWSLSVEEQFYFAWPLIVMVCASFVRSRRALGIVGALVTLAAIVNRLVLFDGTDRERPFGTDFRVDVILAGALLAIFMQSGGAEKLRRATRIAVIPSVVFLLGICILVPDVHAYGDSTAIYLYYAVGLPLIALATSCVVGFVATHQDGNMARALSVKPLEYLGQISYGMYLWHFPIMVLAVSALHLGPNLLFVGSLIGTVVVASLSWRLVERPLSERFHARLAVQTKPDVASQH
jgi:peptidoglycan/LPS O-acetylase OafA/YrhL